MMGANAGHPALGWNADLLQAAAARVSSAAQAAGEQLELAPGSLHARAEAAAAAAATAAPEEGRVYGPGYMWSDYPKAITETYLDNKLLATASQVKQDAAHVVFRGKELVPDNAPYTGGATSLWL